MSKLSKFAELAKVLVPVVLPLVNPKLSPLSQNITQGIIEAEGIKGASGPDKLQHVLNIAANTAQGINSTAGHVVVDPSGLTQSVALGVNAAIAAINAVHQHAPSE